MKLSNIVVLDRLRGLEWWEVEGKRYSLPCDTPLEKAKKIIKEQNINVITIGVVDGWGYAGYPSKFFPHRPDMNPDWVMKFIQICHEHDVAVIAWVPFNPQDVRSVEEYQLIKMFPDWSIKFIEDPEREFPQRVGMCLGSSPFHKWYIKALCEVAELGVDGMFFDGFYFAGVPHPLKPGCVCKYCEHKFKEATGLSLPEKVDWNSHTFKVWVRWRNQEMIDTADYFTRELQKVNPDLAVTSNCNTWPFGGLTKDWHTAVPAWRSSSFGTSQHAHSGKPEEEWIMIGYKARLSKDINPRHSDIWRSWMPNFSFTGSEDDRRRHELQLRTFVLAGLTYGVTPWFDGPSDPPGLGRSMYDAIKVREVYFERNEIKHVGVLLSQNTHDFYGHMPGTDNLALYRDGMVGTWLLLTEDHIPFQFVFDNQLEQGDMDGFHILILPNAAALSDKAIKSLTKWVKEGGYLIATFETSLFNEWGEKRIDFGLKDILGVSASQFSDLSAMSLSGNKVTYNTYGYGKTHYLPFESGVVYARKRDKKLASILLDIIRKVPLPIEIEAPASLVVNTFYSKDKESILVHFLNVSAFMPYEDTGFRGMQASSIKKDTSTDAMLTASKATVVRNNIPARNIIIYPKAWRVRSASLVVAKKIVKQRSDNSFLVPVVNDHEIIELRLEKSEEE